MPMRPDRRKTLHMIADLLIENADTIRGLADHEKLEPDHVLNHLDRMFMEIQDQIAQERRKVYVSQNATTEKSCNPAQQK